MLTPNQIKTILLQPLAETVAKPQVSIDSLSVAVAKRLDENLTEEHLENLRSRMEMRKSFPKMGDIISGLKSSHQPIDGPVGPKGRYVDYADKGKRDDAAWAEGVAICRGTELGAQSVREHWSPALLQFAVANSRLPKGSEIDAQKALGLKNNAAAKDSANGVWTKPLIDLRLSMLTKCASDFGFDFPSGEPVSG